MTTPTQRRLSGPAHTARTLSAMTRAELSASAAYRGQAVLSAFAWVLPLAMMVLWRAVATGPSQAARVTTYFIAVMMAKRLDPFRMTPLRFSDLVREGRLGAALLRPIHPLWALVARNLAQIALSLVATLTLTTVVAIVIPTTITTDPSAWLVAALSFAVGLAGVGMLAMMAASIALWTTSAEGLQSLNFAAYNVIGGMFVPFALLGAGAARWVICQPYWLTVGGPAELIAGLRSPGEMVTPLLAGLVWIAFLIPTSRWVWRRGLAVSETVGG